MSDSLVRLKVNSSEWDSKLKNASDQLNRYMEGCRKAGGTLEILDEGVMDVIKSLGNMETKAQSTRGQLRELTEALTGLTASYRDLSDAERNSETGKAMEDAMSKLTQRAGNLKDAMADVNRAISGQASDTRVFDQLSGGAQMVTASFQTLQGASKMLGFDIGNDVEAIAKLQAAMAVTTGLTQIQNAVQKESAVMQGVMAVQAKAAAAAQALQTSTVKGATVAQAAFNAVAKANPYVLMASAVAAVGTALFAFSGKANEATAAIKTNTLAMDEAKRMSDIWRNTMQGTFSSLMTKYDELKRQWLSLKDEHQKIEWIKKNQQALAGLGQSITDVKGAEDFFTQNTDAVVEAFVRRAQAAARVAQLTELYRKQIELLDKKQQTQDAIAKDAQAYGRSAQAGDEIKDSSYWNSRYGAINQRTGKWEFHEAGAKLYSGTDTSTAQSVQKIDVQIKANQQEIDKVKGQIENDFKDINVVIPTRSVTTGGSVSTEAQNEIQKNEASIAKLTDEYQKLATDAKTANDAQLSGIKERQSAIQTEIANLKTRNEELKKFAAEAQGLQVNIGMNSSLPDLTNKLKELQAAQSQALNGTEWQEYQKQIEQVSLQIDAMKGKWKDGMKATISVNTESIQKAIGESSKLQDLITKPKKQTSSAAVESNANNVAADASKLEDIITKPKTGKVTITADITDAKSKIGEVDAMIGDKTLTVTAMTAEAENALSNIEGLTLQPKELDITADVQKVLDAITQIDGVTVDPKTLEITAGTAEAYAKLQELFANIDGTTVSFNVEPKQTEMSTGISITTQSGMNAYISQLKNDLANADLGSELYNSIATKLTDMTSLSNLVAESLKAGLGTSLFDAADILGADFWTRAMEGGVEDIDWQGIVDKINEKLQEMDLKPISLDFKTGNVTVDGKNQDTKAASGKDNMSQLINNVHTMTRCLEDMGIEVPAGFTKVISSMNLVTTILQTIQSITTASNAIGKGGGIIGLVGGLFSSIFGGFFAGGGLVPHAANGMVVPGNDHMDRTLIAASSGELILNAAQQNTVAGLLTQAPAANMGRTEAYIESDQIRICLLNGAQAKGMTLGQYLGIGG